MPSLSHGRPGLPAWAQTNGRASVPALPVPHRRNLHRSDTGKHAILATRTEPERHHAACARGRRVSFYCTFRAALLYLPRGPCARPRTARGDAGSLRPA